MKALLWQRKHNVFIPMLNLGARAFNNDMFLTGEGRVHGGEYNCNGMETRLVHCAQETRQCERNEHAGVRCIGGTYYVHKKSV